ncbi:hypothetical protein U9M48_005012 [Paspalum notatum var. saurae]|uniref:Uncharacterized protein n=1 Tax=Paspalum notatum var. saurae TaxID=547442 RepID=A0AAQ3PP71_PASNO
MAFLPGFLKTAMAVSASSICMADQAILEDILIARSLSRLDAHLCMRPAAPSLQQPTPRWPGGAPHPRLGGRMACARCPAPRHPRAPAVPARRARAQASLCPVRRGRVSLCPASALPLAPGGARTRASAAVRLGPLLRSPISPSSGGQDAVLDAEAE